MGIKTKVLIDGVPLESFVKDGRLFTINIDDIKSIDALHESATTRFIKFTCTGVLPDFYKDAKKQMRDKLTLNDEKSI